MRVLRILIGGGLLSGTMSTPRACVDSVTMGSGVQEENLGRTPAERVERRLRLPAVPGIRSPSPGPGWEREVSVRRGTGRRETESGPFRGSRAPEADVPASFLERLTVSDFFEGRPEARAIFDAVRAAIDVCGAATVHVSESQVGFRRDRLFAAAWVPNQYLHGARSPLVLTLFLPYRASSERWKEVVEPRPGRFTHHLELARPDEVDAEVRRLVSLAWEAAEEPRPA